ncbi:MAG TPA: hypothetical protein VIZ22_04590 [Candidatus Limnocylindrales bacterium]
MRNPSHRPHRILAIAGALVLGATALAAPVLAKEGMAAELDAPVAGGTPGGTTLLIGMTVTVLYDGTQHLVDGSTLYVGLIGPDGAATRAMAQEGARGHYTARVEVPASGVAGIEVGFDGSTDRPLMITGTAIVPGAITARTAQVAPVVTPITPIARASAGPPVVAKPAVAPPAVAPTAQPAATPSPAPMVLAAGLVALVLLIAAAVIASRRSRLVAGLPVSDPVREA